MAGCRKLLCVVVAVVCAATEVSPALAEAQNANVASFELMWSTLRDRYWDRTMAGQNWQAIHDQYLPEIEKARTTDEARAVMNRMIALLPSSHLAIIPGWTYKKRSKPSENPAADKKNDSEEPEEKDDDEGTASTGLTLTVIGNRVVVEAVEKGSMADQAGVHAGWTVDAVRGIPTGELFTTLGPPERLAKEFLIPEVVQSWLNGPAGSAVTVAFTTGDGKNVTRDLAREQPKGTLIRFGNLPPERVRIEHKFLDNGAGYIQLNIFLNPVVVMPEIQSAIKDFKDAPGIVFDLRNNPGGIGGMAMGIAGWFVGEEGKRLGTMTNREAKLNFVINPRVYVYKGRLAVLVNEGSASTTEIFAQGLQDLGRACVFGTRTAGAALPSEIIRLPNGDRFQYPEANYVSVKGRVLEGNGAQPDVLVAPTIPALLEGRDLPLEQASAWAAEKTDKR